MAYKRKEILEKAKDVIIKKNLLFIEDIVSYLPCDKTTFYRFFPPESNEYNAIKELLEHNRVVIKNNMRKKWYDSNNASLQIALMKMICTDEEAHRLNGSNIKADVTSGGKEIVQAGISTITVNIVNPLDYDDDDDDDDETEGL